MAVSHRVISTCVTCRSFLLAYSRTFCSRTGTVRHHYASANATLYSESEIATISSSYWLVDEIGVPWSVPWMRRSVARVPGGLLSVASANGPDSPRPLMEFHHTSLRSALGTRLRQGCENSCLPRPRSCSAQLLQKIRLWTQLLRNTGRYHSFHLSS